MGPDLSIHDKASSINKEYYEAYLILRDHLEQSLARLALLNQEEPSGPLNRSKNKKAIRQAEEERLSLEGQISDILNKASSFFGPHAHPNNHSLLEAIIELAKQEDRNRELIDSSPTQEIQVIKTYPS